ncbi:MAG: hypothetical protein H6600_03520 [Flavobacteriales bacterium]|nr:hypothetical protein [Flavobacteriales bacterium]
MDTQNTQELIYQVVKEKSVLKQDVFHNIQLNFRILKIVLKEMGDDLKEKMKEIDERVVIEYRDVDDFEAHLRVGGDILIFHMHTNVFKFDDGNSLWKTSYLKENVNRGYCGVINVYNFLTDSYKYNRLNDLGYLIARIFINNENHFMVQGKRQLGFLYNDLINAVIDKDNMKAIVQSTILYALDFDLYIPPYDQVKEVSVYEMQQLSEGLRMKTGKRLGFRFQADSDEV